jgi:spore coat protein U-like protein
MKIMILNQRVNKVLLALALITVVNVATAATATANIAVSATISQNCTISTTPIVFGAYDPVSGGNVTASGTVVVACTKGATSTYVGLGNGANFTTIRNMLGGTSGDKLAYTLVQPVSAIPLAACPAFGANTAWGSTSGTSPVIGTPTSKVARTFNVCGQIASGQDISVDSYTDTVIATINF